MTENQPPGLCGAAPTLFALASGRGPAGVAVIRLSGPRAQDAVRQLCGGQRLPQPRQLALRRLVEPGSNEPLDTALVVVFPGPGSFTGEDVAELHVHGGSAVVAAVLAALGGMAGLAAAGPGAFTRRAFDNGRLDLTAVEGLADLVAAETQAQRRQALRQMEGGLGQLYEGWRQTLVGLLAHAEADIEFGEEEGDVPAGLGARALDALSGLDDAMAAHLGDRRGQRLRDGLTIVVAGPPNAGKSSLVNQIASRDVAIVSAAPGTTRDVIEVHLDLGGIPVCLVDTAGLHDSADPVEQEGMRRARARAAFADLVLAVDDGRGDWVQAGEGPVIRLRNKIDRDGVPPGPVADATVETWAVSAVTGDGIAAVLERLAGWAGERIGDAEAPAYTRERHRATLEVVRGHLSRAIRQSDPVLAVEDIRLAVRALGRLTGRVDVEDVLDVIFADFCIGK